MPRLTKDELDSLLSKPGQLARIATVDADAMPRVLPLWFIVKENLLYFTPRSPAIIWKNILRDNKIAICIDEEDSPYRKVTYQARVMVVHQPGEDDIWRDLYRAIASRYTPKEWANAYVDNTDDQPRALCAIDLDAPSTQTVTWRMPIQGENPAGIWATRYYLPGTKMRPAATDL